MTTWKDWLNACRTPMDYCRLVRVLDTYEDNTVFLWNNLICITKQMILHRLWPHLEEYEVLLQWIRGGCDRLSVSVHICSNIHALEMFSAEVVAHPPTGLMLFWCWEDLERCSPSAL